ncbi:MAG TPA: hypothetical protein VFF70_12950 [Anaerolineae bacterium]|nr:hypothetical protein [Anaerolineae bacterium]
MPKSNRLDLNRGMWIALIASTIGLTLACLRMWWQPILADEWDFYRAMIDWLNNRALIPHPQAYIHFAQLNLSIFGTSIGSARLAGVFSAIASVWLIPVLVHYAWPDHPQRDRFTVIAIILTAINPLTLQNAMILDIDNTLLIPATMILIIAWAATLHSSRRTRIIVVSLTLAFNLWVKLPTPPLIMASLGLYHLARREWKRAGEIILTSLLGLAIFSLTFMIYSALSGYQLSYFGMTFGRAGSFFNLRDLITRFPQGLGVFVMWLSLPLTILLLIAVIESARRLWHKRTTPADAIILGVIIVGLFYPLVYVPAWGYPRYQAPIVPLISTLVAALIVPYTLSLPKSVVRGLLILGAILLALNLWLLPDPLYPIYQVTFEGDLYDITHRLLGGLKVVAEIGVPIILLLIAGTIYARRQKLDGGAARRRILSLLTVVTLAALSFTQVNADYSTRYRYTYNYADYWWSVREAQSLGLNANIMAIKDALWESGLPGEEIYPYLCADCSPSLVDTIHARRIDALIWTTKEASRSGGLTDDPKFNAALDACYSRSTRGVFIVYLLKNATPCK